MHTKSGNNVCIRKYWLGCHATPRLCRYVTGDGKSTQLWLCHQNKKKSKKSHTGVEVIVSALERGQSVSVVGLNKKYIKNELKSGGRARQTKTKKQKVVSGREGVGKEYQIKTK